MLCPFSSHLHEGVAVQSKSSTGNLLKALAHISQRASSQDLRLVVNDESQGNTEKNFGSLVEKTIPDPQNCLQSQETRNRSVKWHALTSRWIPHLSTPTFTHLNWEYVNVEADEPAWHHQCPYARILGHELPYCRSFSLHQLPENLLVSLQAHHGWTVEVYNIHKVDKVTCLSECNRDTCWLTL